jgi:hypothetical protein
VLNCSCALAARVFGTRINRIQIMYSVVHGEKIHKRQLPAGTQQWACRWVRLANLDLQWCNRQPCLLLRCDGSRWCSNLKPRFEHHLGLLLRGQQQRSLHRSDALPRHVHAPRLRIQPHRHVSAPRGALQRGRGSSDWG